MAITRDPLWYKDAIIYEVYVRSFRDSTGSGTGDFRGLTEKLDYLAALGINCIWLLPFYESPMRDGGYDISEYTRIHPEFGEMRDFTRFVRAAHERGMRVITELVINHTSDAHPWFQRARHAPRGSAARNMYVWSDTDDRYRDTRIIFTDTEKSNWTWDPVAEQYYWHRFFSHQPDLNFESRRVRRAIKNSIKFWLERGVDGLRLDAVPYLCEAEGTNCENLPGTHEVLREIREFVDAHFEDRMLLAEANQWPEDVVPYFGEGTDECHMAFHFPVMPRMFMALHQEDRHPIVDILEQTPPIPEQSQWALFLRNHDELTLEMVTDEERDYMYQVYATDPRMRLNIGIRRRLAPLLNNNRRAMELLNSLLFSLPGTPIIYYGDELAMGDNVFLGDRDGVRTPMQWNGDRNAGFSEADPQRLYLPPIMDAVYGYQAVNVEAQERSPSSLLNWMRRLIALRRERTVFGRGEMHLLHPENRSVLAFLRTHGEDVVLVVANLSRFVQPVELDLSGYAGATPTEMIGRRTFPPVGDEPYFLSLGPHAFLWFDIVRQPAPIGIDTEREPVLPVSGDWDGLFEGEARRRLERELLPAFLPAQRWFGAKDAAIERVRLIERVPVRRGASPSWLALFEVNSERREPEIYCLPLAVTAGRLAQAVIDGHPESVIARVEGARGRGLLFDATASDPSCRSLLELLTEQRARRGWSGELSAWRGDAFAELYEGLEDRPAVHRSSSEQSNTSIRFDGQLILKIMRRLSPGVHPEIEIGRHLTDRARFQSTPRLAGSLRYTFADGTPATLASLHEYTWNQGDGWSMTLEQVRRLLEEAGIVLADVRTEAPPDPPFVEYARVLGMRTAEMHLALADARGDPDFEPEPLSRRDIASLVARIRRRLRRVAPALRRRARTGEAGIGEDARVVLEEAGHAIERLAGDGEPAEPITKIRCHGDYHLGQVLWVREDFAIVDFEGEVGLSLQERRAKSSVFVDIAGMLRSFQYAALVALRDHASTVPDSELELERGEPWVSWWEQRGRERFLQSYLETAEGASFLPQDEGQRQRLLDLHLLDKALHELEYELDHRPDWVWIPLRGIAAMVRSLEEVAR